MNTAVSILLDAAALPSLQVGPVLVNNELNKGGET